MKHRVTYNHQSQFIEMFGNPLFSDKADAVSIREAVKIVLGSTPNSKEERFWNGNLCWITPAELSDDSFEVGETERHISEEGAKSANLTLMPKGTVLLSTRAPIGKVALITTPMFCNQGFKNMICTSGLNNVFLYYTLKYNRGKLQSMGTGTTFKELSKKVVESIKISIPDIKLQMKFEGIYRQADKSKFDGFKSQFIEMFGNLPEKANWESVVTITNGKKFPGEYQTDGKYKICGSGGTMGYGDISMCSANTIILGRKGNINTPIYMDEPYWIVDTAFCLQPLDLLHPIYLYYWCKQYDFTRLNKQAVLPSLTKNDLYALQIAVPPMKLQEEFAAIVRQADKSKYYVQNKLNYICHILTKQIPLRRCS